MTQPMNTEARLRRLEDRAELAELIARYALAVDDRDLEAIAALFTPDGAFRSKDGVMQARGTEAVLEQFRGRFRALKLSNHFSHDHVFELRRRRRCGHRAGHRARGSVAQWPRAHRRAALRGQLPPPPGSLVLRRPSAVFLYYLPVEEYASALGDPLRQRAYGDRRPADFPGSRCRAGSSYHDKS